MAQLQLPSKILICDTKMSEYFVIWGIIAKFAFNIKVL